jgi:hypothetical protein
MPLIYANLNLQTEQVDHPGSDAFSNSKLVGRYYLNIHEDKRGRNFCIERAVCAGDGPWVDVEVALVLVRLKLVSLAADQDVAIQLTI